MRGATWHWKDGVHRVAFDTDCSTTTDGRAVCDDPASTGHD